MNWRLFGSALVLGMAMAFPSEGEAQTETEPVPEGTSPPAAGASPEPTPPPEAEDAPAADAEPAQAEQPEVPPVEVIQPRPAEEPRPRPRPAAAPRRPAPSPRPAPVVAPAPPPAPIEAEPAPIEPELQLPSLITQPSPGYYGPPGGVGNFERTMHSSQSPIVPTQGIIPGDLSDFSSAASRVTRQQIDEQEPLTTNDILARVPGVAIVNDDGLGRHGGVSIRGTPARRSRKVAVLEDGRFINQSIWLDPSTHYTPPSDRIESVEVLRGTVIVYGPNNNSGVVNFRNLQPFGQKESVVSAEGGWVGLQGGHFEGISRDLDDGSAAKWHVHTRQTSGDWGLVLSYTGANAQGAWDTERLRYHDLYGAIGWKGEKSDFTFSTVYFAQRDNYDESNLEGDDDGEPGEVERIFFRDVKQCKSCFNPGSVLNEYNADILLMQGIYNYYVNQDTTVSARVYGQLVDRARFFNIEAEDPRRAEGSARPVIFDEDGELAVAAALGTMEGRYRTFDNIGTELRTEFANRPFLFGLSQDVQAGVRFEYHEFTDRSFLGNQGQILNDFDSRGLDVWNREFTADAFSAFLQTDVTVTDRLNVVPGVRLENYHITRRTNVLTVDDEEEDCPEGIDQEECVIFEGFENDPFTEKFTRTHVLPGVAFAWGFGPKEAVVDYGSKSLKPAAKPKYKSTVYGGYHRGLTMQVLREVTFPPGDELGDNYQIGLRSTALRGITFDIAGFHQSIQDYQAAGEFSLATDRGFESVDLVHVNGFEVYGRLDTRPFTGWRLNPYTEASFTYADSKIEKGFVPRSEDDEVELVNVAGNDVPVAPREYAYLTAGIESTAGWNASVSWIYRGSFYTDVFNTPYGADPEGEAGEVPSVWLLAARFNYTIPNTDAVLFVSGQNLTNELYITDREDGIKPGLGRTIMAGAKIKW